MAYSLGLLKAEVLPHLDRFMGFVEKQDSGCWFRYSRARNSGYTTLQVDGRRIGAHRFAYAAFVGDIPPGMEVDHLCRDRGCVNPEHLELVDRATNLSRRDEANPGDFAARGLEERLHSRLEPNGDCLEWTGALVRGYGVISVDGKTKYVHRVSFELQHGPIPAENDLDHKCRNPKCANPEHLEPVTRSVNVARMLDKQPKDRCRRGHKFEEVGKTNQGSCKLCWELANGKKYRPSRAKSTAPATDCRKGHELAAVGRYKTGGCRACQAEKDAKRGRRKNTAVSRYCEQGHDLLEVGMRAGSHCRACWNEGWCLNGHDMNQTGRTSKGACKACREETRVRHAETMSTRATCAQGHELAIVGVSNGKCRECAREYARRKYGYLTTADQLKNECRNGHPRTPENTKSITRVRNGKTHAERVCLECARERNRRHYAKN